MVFKTILTAESRIRKKSTTKTKPPLFLMKCTHLHLLPHIHMNTWTEVKSRAHMKRKEKSRAMARMLPFRFRLTSFRPIGLCAKLESLMHCFALLSNISRYFGNLFFIWNSRLLVACPVLRLTERFPLSFGQLSRLKDNRTSLEIAPFYICFPHALQRYVETSLNDLHLTCAHRAGVSWTKHFKVLI